MSTFGERIGYILSEQGLSWRAGARLFEVSPSYIQKLKTGQSTPGGELLQRIARAFPKVSTPWLLLGEGQPFLQSPSRVAEEEAPSRGKSASLPEVGRGITSPTAVFARPASADDNDVYNRHLFIPEQAHGGYAVGYADAGYSELGVYELAFPGLPKPGRTFEVSGDSMLPVLTDGDYIVCSKVEEAAAIREGSIYVVVSATAGVSVKYVQQLREALLAIPANQREYNATRLDLEEVRELWLVEWRITKHFLHPIREAVPPDISRQLEGMQAFLAKKFADFPTGL